MKNNVTFIAEIGMNHNGNFDLCFELIKQAKLAGANIVASNANTTFTKALN